MSDGAMVLTVMVSGLLAAVVALSVGIAVALRGATERRRRIGGWVGIVAALFVLAFGIPMVLGFAINGLPV
ncbi:hypothetical protein LG314_01640 [Agrococcus terreus]|uniref:hypothetical protein n=1 Tax=Agrococcus terreus TaxID=574649 RepID=UPI00385015D4